MYMLLDKVLITETSCNENCPITPPPKSFRSRLNELPKKSVTSKVSFYSQPMCFNKGRTWKTVVSLCCCSSEKRPADVASQCSIWAPLYESGGSGTSGQLSVPSVRRMFFQRSVSKLEVAQPSIRDWQKTWKACNVVLLLLFLLEFSLNSQILNSSHWQLTSNQ